MKWISEFATNLICKQIHLPFEKLIKRSSCQDHSTRCNNNETWANTKTMRTFFCVISTRRVWIRNLCFLTNFKVIFRHLKRVFIKTLTCLLNYKSSKDRKFHWCSLCYQSFRHLKEIIERSESCGICWVSMFQCLTLGLT